MEKALKIEAFRNIGFENEKPKAERLVISNSLKKGELGDLVILIGANNSGKSNVLDALAKYGNGQLERRDVSDLFMDEGCRKPALTLSYKSDSGDEEYSLRKEYGGNVTVKYPNDKKSSFELFFVTKENIESDLTNFIHYERDYIGTTHFNALKNEYKKDFSENDFIEYIKRIFEKIDALNKNNNYYRNMFSNLRNTALFQEYSNNNSQKKDSVKLLEEKFSEKFAYSFDSKITKYIEKQITNNDLKSDYNYIERNFFFVELFNAIKVDITEIKNAAKTFEEQQNIGILKQLEIKLNKKMKTVSRDFNKLYYLDDASYSFQLVLESDKMWFAVYRGEQTLFLDYQSTGFKWFFNLYFNLLNSQEINPGDIIIMDEPATNLHTKGQRELRLFLKEFAIHNDITIIIATHSPFLIDLDYLDELRIVENKNNITSIANNFAAVNPNDPDSLLPVKESLTVENHVICNPEEKIVFVEGITDYNYLVSFKKLLGKTGITFLPINGIGKSKEENEKISKRLIEIRKKDPMLLVDSDKAGKNMVETNNDSELEIIQLDSIDEKFKTIESLFSPEDLKKFNLVDSKGKFIKHASTSTLFKNAVLKNKDSISEVTKKNFEKIIDRLME